MITEIREKYNGQSITLIYDDGHVENYDKMSIEASHHVVVNGLPEHLYELERMCCNVNTFTCLFAAAYGKLEHLKVLHDIDPTLFIVRATDLAAENGNIECLQYLLGVKCPFRMESVYLAAKNGHLECLKLIIDHDRHHFKYASCLVTHEKKFGLSTMIVAAENGHLKCLVYLYEAGFAFNYHVTEAAHKNKHRDCANFIIGVTPRR